MNAEHPPLPTKLLRTPRLSSPLALAAALLLLPALCAGQIYKWQDENGKWHFSDKPPAGEAEAEVLDTAGKGTKAPVSKDLKADLYEKYAPKTPVEAATLAVVAVHTPLGHGSGFFLSEDGYIVTNQHVVRPENMGALDGADEKLAEIEAAYDRAKAEMDRQRADFKVLRDNLERAKQILESAKAGQSSSEVAYAQAQYEAHKRRHDNYKNVYYDNKRVFDKQEREYRIAKTDFSMKRSRSAMATNFKVALKDGTEVMARLISLSQDNDLALLKVDGYATPALAAGSSAALSQGAAVYAIGSPLGISDTLTSGIVTRIDRDFIFTDAQIHPGSSGGPLISESGEVVGINTIKVVDRETTGSFGLAIPIDVASREFGPKMR